MPRSFSGGRSGGRSGILSSGTAGLGFAMPGSYDYSMATMGGLQSSAAQGNPYAKEEIERRKNDPNSLVNQYQKMATEAKASNLAREKEIRGIYADILNQISGSNKSLRASGLADIERQSAKLTGQETQQMISSGLYGTTTAAAIPRNVEAGFAQPARLKLEDLLATRKKEAQLGLAGFVERIQTPYPDYSGLMQAQIAANQ